MAMPMAVHTALDMSMHMPMHMTSLCPNQLTVLPLAIVVLVDLFELAPTFVRPPARPPARPAGARAHVFVHACELVQVSASERACVRGLCAWPVCVACVRGLWVA